MFLLDGHHPAPDTASGASPAPRLVHSARDVVLAAECEFASLRRLDEVLGRAPRRDRVADATLARTLALGTAHEQRALAAHLARFGRAPADGGPGGVAEIAPPSSMTWDELAGAHARTLGALERGADVVAQAAFFDGRFHGRADFLVRAGGVGGRAGAEADDGGRPRYAVWEAKLARRAKVPALLQVAAYAEQLAAAGADPTEHGHLLLGTGVASQHLLAEVLPVFRARRDRLLEVVAAHVADGGPVGWGDPRFDACGRLGVCPDCSEAAERHRDVLLVGGVYPRQRATLVAAGVTTIDALAAAEQPPAGMSAGAFSKVRSQAALQLGTDPGDGRVRYEVAGAAGPETAELRWAMPDPSAVDRLPAPSPGDVFFDFEGDPLWTDPQGHGPGAGYGLDYLFGWVTRPGVDDGVGVAPDRGADAGVPPFHGLWADTPAQERDALVAFVDWLNERRRRWPDLHVYHYADYERSHLLSIAARHGTYEDEVDDLLREGVLVDLWKVVRPSLRISHRSRSIKKLEPLYMSAEPGREGVTDAAASIVEYAEYTGLLAAGRIEEAADRKAQILDYNRYDCVSTLRLLDWLRDARAQVNGRVAAEPAAAPARVPDQVSARPEVSLAGGADGGGGPGAAADGGGPGAAPAEPTRRELDVRRRLALEDDVRAVVEAERDVAAERDAVAASAPAVLDEAARLAEGRDAGAPALAAEVRALALLGASVGYYRREAKPFWHEHFARLESPPDEWPGRRSSMVVESADVLRGWEIEPGRSTASRLLTLRGRAVEGSELVPGAPVWLLYDEPVPAGVGEPPIGAARAAHRRASIVDPPAEPFGAGVPTPVDPGAPTPVIPGAPIGVGGTGGAPGGRGGTPSAGAAAQEQVLVVREQLRRADSPYDARPMGVALDGLVQTGPQEQAVEDAATEALAAWRRSGRLPAGPAVDLLVRRAPRLVGGEALPSPSILRQAQDGALRQAQDGVLRQAQDGVLRQAQDGALRQAQDGALRQAQDGASPGESEEPDLVAAVLAAVRRLDRSFLAVQGPPGTGKTRLGSRVVAELVASGWRVGVVAQSHAVVENLLAAALRAGVPPERVAKKRRDRTGAPPVAWAEVSPEALAEVAASAERSGHGCLVGGTAWDFAHGRWPAEGLDLLVVDEAGQFSLANTVAVARAARRLLLLGDPQQLGQVSRGSHPEPAVAGSALSWLAGGRDVLPDRFGYFLPASYRMHPDLCGEVSRLAYEGRLHAHPRAGARRLEGVEPGVRHVLVDHDGDEVASSAEADEVVRQVRAVLGHSWHPGDGPARPLGTADVLVVAAYNAQVATVRRALDAAGLPDVPVGTVDLFQGREAPVVILTLAASSPDRVARGMGFLLDRHRVNVAVSRGQWCAVIVRSPRLADYLPHSVRGLEQLGAFLRLGSPS
ncbi:hypothetical protein GCM10009809_16920 [Isoptericola hypogeus]|uniref:AAA+ ATPase domain-containing protein n=1 Tax=Isoptericola hypogeus TaxID=300179 RepID=A0ABN2JBF6_9MICO